MTEAMETGIVQMAKMYAQRVSVGTIDRPAPTTVDAPKGVMAVGVFLIVEAWWCEARHFGEIAWATQFEVPRDQVHVTDAESDDPDAARERLVRETSMLLSGDLVYGRKFVITEDSAGGAGAFVRAVIAFELDRTKLLAEAIAGYGKSGTTIDDILGKGEE